MARIKIRFPEKVLFTTLLKVRITDINYGNHLANDAVLGLAHEARLQFLQSLNYSETNIEGLGLIMADAAIVFKNQGFYADKLQFDLGIEDVSPFGFDLYYRLSKMEKEVATVKTGMVFYDYQQQKVSKMPLPFKEALGY